MSASIAPMDTWKIQALLAALFAGLTSVLAKAGMSTLGADMSLALRTAVVFVFITANAFYWSAGHPIAVLSKLPARDIVLLTLSGATAALSWIFYFRAVQTGTVSFVALVDKGSILITLLLSFWFLSEPFTARIAIGAALVLGGILVLTWK